MGDTADKFVYSYYNTNRPNCKQQAGRGQNGSYLSFDLPNTRQSPAMPTHSPTNANGISDMLAKIVSFRPSCAQLSRMPNNSNAIPLILSSIGNLLRQHRTIPALRLKHRSGGCGTASALPKCSIRHPVLSALLA